MENDLDDPENKDLASIVAKRRESLSQRILLLEAELVQYSGLKKEDQRCFSFETAKNNDHHQDNDKESEFLVSIWLQKLYHEYPWPALIPSIPIPRTYPFTLLSKIFVKQPKWLLV
jgi:hypothetical protein